MKEINYKYVIWFDKTIPRSYVVDTISGLGDFKDSELRLGEPLLKKWPNGAYCEVIDGDPKKPVFADSLINIYKQLIISERLKNSLQELVTGDIEFLPVRLKEGTKDFGLTYYIVHLLNLPDCLDPKASGARMSNIVKTKVKEIKKLVFIDDPKRDLFRPVNYGDATIISLELAGALSRQRFSGISWRLLFDHPRTDESRKKDPMHDTIKRLHDLLAESTPTTIKSSGRKKIKLTEIPLDEIKKWAASLKGHKEINGSTFIPMPGEEMWLESYNDNPDQWPVFNPKKYYCLGNNGQSDYWLLDLVNGFVVYFTHEAGYDSKNFDEVIESFDEFKKMIGRYRRD